MGKKLTSFILSGILSFSPLISSCIGDDSNKLEQFVEPKYVYGTVLEEGGSIVDKRPSEDYGYTYALKFKKDSGEIYGIEIQNWRGEKDALNLLINEGTRIKIEASDFQMGLEGKNIIHLYPYQIEVLPEE